MTYKELKEKLDKLTEEQLMTDVTIFDTVERQFYGGIDFGITDESDVLDAGHPYFIY